MLYQAMNCGIIALRQVAVLTLALSDSARHPLLPLSGCFLGSVFRPLSRGEREKSTGVRVVCEKTYPCKLPNTLIWKPL
jgi:hypothetical protein